MSFIYLIPVEVDNDFWIEELMQAVRQTFKIAPKLGKANISLERAFDAGRIQYNSSNILLQLIDNPPQDALKMLAIVEVDLFIPILTFVFGEAQLNGQASIISLHRLNNKYYGLPENKKLLTERLIKEAIHELGHNFGLIHCRDHRCVMKSSTYVEDIDFKSTELCPRCFEQLRICWR